MNNKSLTRRALYSLTKVRGLKRKEDLLLKTLTFANLVLKFLWSFWKTNYTRMKKWPYNDCLAKVSFFDIEYLFQLSQGNEFNIYLNPYFHEYDVTSLAWLLLNENDIFIDVGAHAGLYTMIASKKVGVNGKVISIEPNPRNLEFLRLNAELNEFKNVHIIPKAGGETLEYMKLYYYPGDDLFTSAFRKESQKVFSAFRKESQKVFSAFRKESQNKMLKSFDVEVTTLDQIYEKMIKPKSVKMVKIDTEDFDLYVLKGAKNMLTKIQYLIIEDNTHEVRSYLAKHGFKLKTLEPSKYLLAINPKEK